MPRGVYDRSKAKPRTRKNKVASKKIVSSKKPVNMKPVNKKPVKAAAPVVLAEMDVPAFLAKLDEVCKALREASEMTNHVKEAELLKNFAICIERQLPPKYKDPEEAERV